MPKIIFRPLSIPTAQPSPQPSWPPMDVPYSDQQGLRLGGYDESELTITLELMQGFEFPVFTRAGIAQFANGVQFGFLECEAVVWGDTNLDLTFSDQESWLEGVNYCNENGNIVFGLADNSYVNTGFLVS